MSSPHLRGCPACSRPFKEGELGLRDYCWLDLPGRAAPMDLDFVLERNGDFLVMEFKPPTVKNSRGAEITFDHLRAKGFEVWTVEGDTTNMDDESRLRVNWNGAGAFADMKRKTLKNTVEKWYSARTSVMRNPKGETDER